MENEITPFVNFIKEKIGIDLTVYNNSGNNITEQNGERLLFLVTDILVDDANEFTYFPFINKGVNYVGRIGGTGDLEKKLALLIAATSESFTEKGDNLSKQEFLKEILVGKLNLFSLRKYISQYKLPNKPCQAMIVSYPIGFGKDIVSFLESYNGGDDFAVEISENYCAMVKYYENDNVDYQSSIEYAEVLVQSVKEEFNVKINVYMGSKVNSVFDVSDSYKEAELAFNEKEIFPQVSSVHSVKDYVLIRLLEELPKEKLAEYLNILATENSREIFNDDEIVYTAEVFLDNSLNVSETSRKLFLHRNTLMYRLDKIAKQTGLDLRVFSDAVTFRLVSIISKLLR